MNQKVNKQITVKYFFLIILTCISFFSLAEKQRVYFAGVAFLGEAKDIDNNLPFSSKYLLGKNLDALNTAIFDAVKSSSNKHNFELSNELGNSDSGDAIAMAIALDLEELNVLEDDEGFPVIADLSYQILTFDFTTKKILSAYPVVVNKNTFFDDAPTQAQLDEVKLSFFTDNSKQTSITNSFVNKLPEVDLSSSGRAFMQVRSVEFGKHASKIMKALDIEPEYLRTWLAGVMSSKLSKNQRLPILPYARGDAIGSAMALRFASGSATSFRLPPADYAIDIALVGLAKKIVQENKHQIWPSYISAIKVDFVRTSRNKTQFSAIAQKGMLPPTKAGYSKRHYKSMKDDIQYKVALNILLDMYTKQLDSPDEDWVEEYLRLKGKSDKELFKEMKKLNGKMLVKVRGKTK